PSPGGEGRGEGEICLSSTRVKLRRSALHPPSSILHPLLRPVSLAIIVLLASLLATHARTTEILTVAVFDFESRDDGMREAGRNAATVIGANLSTDPHIITVERADLEKILGEQELGLSGTVSPDTAAKVGHLTGAKVLVTGRVFRADKELLMVAK